MVLVFTLFGDGAPETPGVGALVSSSRALFPLSFASIGVEDAGVDAAVCADVDVLTSEGEIALGW
jgi:hypothetical protein